MLLWQVALAEGHALADTLYNNLPRTADHTNVPSGKLCCPPLFHRLAVACAHCPTLNFVESLTAASRVHVAAGVVRGLHRDAGPTGLR